MCEYKDTFFKRFYLFVRDTESERQRHRQREKQAPCREPDGGLDPGSQGSHPEPKADAQPLSHPGIPRIPDFRVILGTILGIQFN